MQKVQWSFPARNAKRFAMWFGIRRTKFGLRRTWASSRKACGDQRQRDGDHQYADGTATFDGHIAVHVSLEDFERRYGTERLAGLMTGLIEHTERLVRSEIAGWPDGTATFTDYLDSDGIERRDTGILSFLGVYLD